MKAPEFEYLQPSSLEEAVAMLRKYDGDAMPLAGGQSLMPMMNFRVATPSALIDLNPLAGLMAGSRSDTHISFGALTRYAEMVVPQRMVDDFPLIAMAMPHIAHDAIRNRGTIGGSLALADPAAEMPAVMMALDAQIELIGPDGPRSIAANDFFLGYYETARRTDELISAVTVPKALPDQHFGFYELAPRHGDYALAGVAIAATKTLQAPRIAFFGVADRAIRVEALEDAVAADPTNLEAALSHLDAIDFVGDTKASAATRKRLAGVCLTRAIEGMLP